MASSFPEVGKYMSARTPARVAARMRGHFGGHILFRPIGLVMFARLTSRVLRRLDMGAAMSELALLPVSLSEPPYADVLWSVRQRRMTTDNASLVARLLTYMLGGKVDRAKLKRDYAKVLGRPMVRTSLPGPVSEILAPEGG